MIPTTRVETSKCPGRTRLCKEQPLPTNRLATETSKHDWFLPKLEALCTSTGVVVVLTTPIWLHSLTGPKQQQLTATVTSFARLTDPQGLWNENDEWIVSDSEITSFK
eukprot:4627548-Amphidinium_carterae.1